MESAPHSQYWETQILTASPQKLRLLLIEGAIKLARQAIDHWQQQRIDSAFNAAIRCQDILFELLSSVRRDGSEINKSVVEIYLFLAKEIQQSIRGRDQEIMAGIIRVLEEERTTWQMVCEKFPLAPEITEIQEVTADDRPAIVPDAITPHFDLNANTHGSLSLDA